MWEGGVAGVAKRSSGRAYEKLDRSRFRRRPIIAL
jgi:hypothetical protein